MPFWRCYYHVIWSTKYRQCVITSTMEPVIYHAIETKCTELNCDVLAVNSVEDHIHIVLSISPAHSIASIVGQLKGTTSREVNQTFELTDRFQWQSGYGVLTFGEKALPQLLDYVKRQKEHHANDTIYRYLEETDD